MQLAENAVELPFEVLEKQLQLTEDQVEEFVLQVLNTKLVRARMDQLNKKRRFCVDRRKLGKHWENAGILGNARSSARPTAKQSNGPSSPP